MSILLKFYLLFKYKIGLYYFKINFQYINLCNFDTLGSLWPGLTLILEDFCCWTNEGIRFLLQLVVNWDETIKKRKLLFKEIKFRKLDLDWLLKKNLRCFNAFINAVKTHYKLHFEDSKTSAVMIGK